MMKVPPPLPFNEGYDIDSKIENGEIALYIATKVGYEGVVQ